MWLWQSRPTRIPGGKPDNDAPAKERRVSLIKLIKELTHVERHSTCDPMDPAPSAPV